MEWIKHLEIKAKTMSGHDDIFRMQIAVVLIRYVYLLHSFCQGIE